MHVWRKHMQAWLAKDMALLGNTQYRLQHMTRQPRDFIDVVRYIRKYPPSTLAAPMTLAGCFHYSLLSVLSYRVSLTDLDLLPRFMLILICLPFLVVLTWPAVKLQQNKLC
ncbi:hypothetical protein V8C44DRAFT_321565 [Trichoderma aethiopicum]